MEADCLFVLCVERKEMPLFVEAGHCLTKQAPICRNSHFKEEKSVFKNELVLFLKNTNQKQLKRVYRLEVQCIKIKGRLKKCELPIKSIEQHNCFRGGHFTKSPKSDVTASVRMVSRSTNATTSPDVSKWTSSSLMSQ